MSFGQDARGAARALSLAATLAAATLPCAAAQPPEAGRAMDAAPADEQSVPILPTLRPTLHLLAGTDEPFDLSAFARPGAAAEKWRLAARDIVRDRAILARCRRAPDGCPAGAALALTIVAAAQAKEGRARLAEVNRAVNLAIRYRSDGAGQGAPDVWIAPIAALGAGEGDCEDYAIAKYMVLQETGIASSDLRLVIVRDMRLEQDHAVLAVRLDDRWLLLDNRRFSLVEDRDAYAYRPLAALGPDTVLVAAADDAAIRPDAPAAFAGESRIDPFRLSRRAADDSRPCSSVPDDGRCRLLCLRGPRSRMGRHSPAGSS